RSLIPVGFVPTARTAASDADLKVPRARICKSGSKNMSHESTVVVPRSPAGVDVSKQELEVCLLSKGEYQTFRNDEAGVAELVEWMRSIPNVAIAIEATGGYERLALYALQEAG